MFPSKIVVSIHLRVEASLNQYRIEATVQQKLGAATLYEQNVTYVGTWQEVITWLGGLMSAADAALPPAFS